MMMIIFSIDRNKLLRIEEFILETLPNVLVIRSSIFILFF
jgi:hypothetical protein